MNIDGIFISQKGVERIRELQEDDNSNLKYYINKLNNLSKKLVMEEEREGKEKQTLAYVANLFAISEIMECLFAEQKGGEL